MAGGRLQVPPLAKRGAVIDVRIAIQHAMETGFRYDLQGRTIPKNVVNSVIARYNGTEVFRAELGSGISANPYLQFSITADASGEIELSWIDDQGQQGSERAPITVA